jgi:tripartite-type tricarboxylate transporter receptor subunit TctC
MHKRLKTFIAASTTAFISVAISSHCYAQEYPIRPVRVIVPYAAGGGSDITIRIVQAKAMELLGQSLIVDNRAGGGTLIGTRMTQTSPADGYTIGVMDPAFIINPTLVKDAGYDALKDFTPVSLITTTPLILVSPPSFPPKTVQELVDHVKANAGKVNYGSPGDGSAGHLAMEQFRSHFGLKMAHIPYKGAGPAVTAVVAAEVPMLIAGSGGVPFIQDGRLRGLAATSAKRLPAIPNVPTFAELGFPQIRGLSYSLNMPAGVPKAAVDKLYSAASRALKSPEIIASFAKIHWEISEQPPEVATRRLIDEANYLAEVAKKVGIQPQ